MPKKPVSWIIITLLFTSSIIWAYRIQLGRSSPLTITVPDDYPTIQEAINHANDGDTVFVKSGTYYENVVVNKSISLFGENRNTTIVDGNGKGTVVQVDGFFISANISRFTIQNGEYGLVLHRAGRCILRENSLQNNQYSFSIGNSLAFELEETGLIQDIDSSNTVNGKPIYYWMNARDKQVPDDAGFVALVNSSNIAVRNLELTGNGYGLLMGWTNNSLVENVTTLNCRYGFGFFNCQSNDVRNSSAINNLEGVLLWGSGNNTLKNTNITGNRRGFDVVGFTLSDNNNCIDLSNTINGKPVYYIVSQKDLVIDPSIYGEIGYLGIVNCTNIIIRNVTLGENGQGLMLAYTNNSLVSQSKFYRNWMGIEITCSSDNVLENNSVIDNTVGVWLSPLEEEWGLGSRACTTGNTIRDNTIQGSGEGIRTDFASTFNNSIYHNNFSNSTRAHAHAILGAHNFWDDGYPSGGNYWSDYIDVDNCSGSYQNETGSDGKWDYPYAIDVNNQDNYPLVNPWTTTPQLWGVIVGVGDYISQEDPVLPANDARDIYSRLISSGWKADHIRLLIDSEATKANVEAAIEWMKTNAGSRDLCLFFFSGHGTYSLNDLPPDAEPDGHDEYICPVDSLQGSHDSNIRDDEFAAWLEGITGPKVVILDSCYSGGFMGDLEGSGQIVILAACEEDRRAMQMLEPQFPHGVFTFYILEGLTGLADTDQNNQISAEEIFSYSSPRVTEYAAQQNEQQLPQLYDGVPGEVIIASTVADSFRFPLDELWTIRQRFGGYNYDWNGYHLGEDVLRSYEAPVYAPANGIVKHNAKSTGYGYVVIIEHELLDGTFVCSVLGHLKEASRIPVGARVTKGQIVGYLSSVPEDNGGIIHLHFGIRKGAYSEELDFDGKWRYRGYGPIDIVGSWCAPSAFIEYYNENKKMPPDYTLTINTEGGGAFAATSSTSVFTLVYKTILTLISPHPWFLHWIGTDNDIPYRTTVTIWLDTVVTEVLSSEPPPTPPSPSELAKDVLGKDYRLQDGNATTKGYEGGRLAEPSDIVNLDCSGLVFWSYNKAYAAKGGQVVYQGANGQYWNDFLTEVSEEELLPGDLLFFDYNHDGHRDHVAMYVGEYEWNGEIRKLRYYSSPGVPRQYAWQPIMDELTEIIGFTNCAGEYDVVQAAGTVGESLGIIPSRKSDLKTDPSFVGFRRYSGPGVEFRSNSPVDLVVTDPDGFTITKDMGEIPGVLYYSECDIDGDGELEDIVASPERKVGDYLITVIPEPGAPPTEDFTLEASANGTTILLADYALISEIPTDPYIITQNETAIMLRNINVAATNVTPSKSVVGQGYSSSINVTVQNQGNLEETFNVTLYANATIITSQAVTPTSGNSSIVTFAWNTSTQPYGNYSISAYAWPVLGETYTADNLLVGGPIQVSIAGDLNGDFTVDIYDAIILANAYNSKPGGQYWNPNADINSDNIVDIYDAIILANHYNQHYP